MNDEGQIVAIRYDDWKAVFLSNRGRQLGVWQEPFIQLRIPLLFNLRRDPFEKSQHNSNTYWDWYIDRAFVLLPMQDIAGKFLRSMVEYPPSQTPGAFNLDKVIEQIQVGRRFEVAPEASRNEADVPVGRPPHFRSRYNRTSPMRAIICAALMAAAHASVRAGDDLPSWNDGRAKESIVAFVRSG